MNVANRKLFTNRDARAKLSSMGGIMASSPELLGEVQKFETGGDVQQSMSDMFTPVQLGESVFYVDMQSGTVLDSQGSVVNDDNIIEAASIQAVEKAQASNTQAPEPVRTLGDVVAENPLTPERDAMFNKIKQQFSNLSPFSSGQATSDDGIMSQALAEIAARNPEAMARINAGTSISSRVTEQNQNQNPLETLRFNFPESEVNLSEAEQLLASTKTSPEAPIFNSVSTDDLILLSNEGDGAAAEEVQRRMNQTNEADVVDPDKNDPRRLGGVDPSFQDGSLYTPRVNEKRTVPDSLGQQILDETVADIKDVFVGGTSYVITPSVLKTFGLTEDDLALDTVVTERELEKLAQEKAEEEDLARALSSTSERSPAQEFREKEEIIAGDLTSMTLEDSKEIRAQRAAEFADGKNPQGPNIVLDPTKIQEEMDEGGSGSKSIIGGLTGTNQNLSPKDSVKAYQAMYKEMLGMDDEDEEKEKWHQMAMIGFAIAAGQDPNALSNIAGGLLEGTKMARKDRMRKKDRDDKFTMMAIQSADEDRRTALAAGVRADERTQDQLNRIALTDLETSQRLIDESRKSNLSLKLYEDKLKIAEMFKTPKSILKTDPALAAISKAFDGVDYDMLGTGENAFSALEKMGFPRPQLKRFSNIVFPGTPYGGSAGVGKGLTADGGGKFTARGNKNDGTN